MDSAFDYIADHGIELEDDYPYRATDQRCKASESRSKFKIVGHKQIKHFYLIFIKELLMFFSN